MGFLKIMMFAVFTAMILIVASFNCVNIGPTTACSYANSLPAMQIITNGFAGAIAVITNFFTGPNALFNIAAGVVAAIAAFFTIYPNPWVIFFAPAVYLFTWSLTPIQLFNASNIGVTDPNAQIVINIVASALQIMATLFLLSWFKGQESIW